MGASCAKGSKTTDPDKTPYQPTEEKKKKGKHGGGGKSAESDKAEGVAAAVEQRDSGTGERERARDERRPPQGIGDAEEVKKKPPRAKTDDPARPRRTSDEHDQPRTSRPSSSEVTPSRSQHHQTAEPKRESRERTGHPEEEEKPKPKKRIPKDERPLLETSIDAGGSLERTPVTKERVPSESEEAPKRKERTTHSRIPDETKKHLDVQIAPDRKRSSLDNEFVVPVKVETKTEVLTSGAPRNQTKEQEHDNHQKFGEEKRSPPDGVRESDVKVKVKVDGNWVTESTPLSTEWKTSETRTHRTEDVRTTEERRTLVVQSDGSRTNTESLIQKREDLSPPWRRAPNDDLDMQPSGLTPVRPRTVGELRSPGGATQNDVIVTSHHSVTSYRSTTSHEGGVTGKPASPTKPPQLSPGGGNTMAIFDALKGLKSLKSDPQKPTQQVIDPSNSTSSSVAAPGQISSSVAMQTSAAVSPVPTGTVSHVPTGSVSPVPTVASSSSSSSPAAVTPRAADGQNHSPPDGRPVPAVRTTILQQSHTTRESTNAVHEERRIATNGHIDISRPGKDDDAKSKQERISKLPVKGAGGSTSPVTSTSPSASLNLSASSPAPPVSPSTPESASSVADRTSKNLRAKSETKKLLVDLSRDNGVLTGAHRVCSNTRAKLLQAIDRWFSGNDKDRENPSRVMAISGRPGIGKTCLAAELCRRYATQLGGAHFFQFCPRRLDQNFASTLLLSLAYQLAEVLPAYSAHLPTPEELRPLLVEGELVKLFEALVTSPFQRVSSDKHLLIVIDALDECYPADRDRLLQVINGLETRTPDWLYVFCTVRDDNQLTTQLDGVHLIEVKGTSDAMTADIKRYLRDPMARLIDRISLDGALTQLTNHSQGSFLAAYLVKRKLEKLPEGTALALRDVALFPSGFGDICKEFFHRFHDHLSKKFSPKELPGIYGGVVGVLATAREKLNTAFVKQVAASLNADEDLVPLQGLLDTDEDGSVGFHHKSISEWLLSDQTAAPLAIDIANARQRMADVVLSWLAPILDDPSSKRAVNVPAQLRQYALKHAVEHLTDVPKQQDSIAALLCSISFIERKLKVPGVTLTDLLRDYDHSHYQVTGTPSKLITLDGYIRRLTNLTEQIDAYHGFIRRNGAQISRYPEFLLQFAANYPTVTRIQQNARMDLSDKPWLEDVTAAAETPSIVRPVAGYICHSDVSPDNRVVAVLTQVEEKVFLSVVNIASGELNGDPIDLGVIPDRKGPCVRFLADNNLLFVGSLSTFVSVKNGKPTPSGLDVQSVQIKERYSVECCDAVAGSLACGLNTLPWGGRSLHMIIFDLKSKTAKTLEVLKFRFGGSAQFGIKACALSSDGIQLSACSKQTNKTDMKVTVYHTGNLNVLYSIDVENDAISRCFFVGNQSLLLCGGTGTPDVLQQTYLWSFNEKQAKCLLAGKPYYCSAAQVKNPQLTFAHRCRGSPQVMVSRWKKETTKLESPDDRHILHGLDELSDMYATEKSLVFLTRNSVRIFKMADMTAVESHPAPGSFALHDSIVEGLSFFSRSDEPIVVHRSALTLGSEIDGGSGVISASRVNVKNDGALSGGELLTNVPWRNDVNGKETVRFQCFQGPWSSTDISSSTPDGGVVVMSTGSGVKVLEVASGTQWSLPKPAEITKVSSEANVSSSAANVICVLSSKESLAGVSYPEKPESLFLFDLKSRAADPTVELRLDTSPISDFAFIPSNGYVISYHKTSDQSLVVWNQRNGSQVSKQAGSDVVYVRSSPSSDRLAVSLRRRDAKTGSLVLRNSDNRFNISLELLPLTLVPEAGCGDVEFSADGTVLMGLFVDARAIRIWNGGNGEPLKDLNFSFIGCSTDVVGMITNTHALLNDGSMLYVCDVDSGDVNCVVHSAQPLASKHSSRGLRISPKGGLIAGSTETGAELRLFQCHNLSSVKRKTSLQLIRSK